MTSYVEEAPMGVQITWDTVDWQYVVDVRFTEQLLRGVQQ